MKYYRDKRIYSPGTFDFQENIQLTMAIKSLRIIEII